VTFQALLFGGGSTFAIGVGLLRTHRARIETLI